MRGSAGLRPSPTLERQCRRSLAGLVGLSEKIRDLDADDPRGQLTTSRTYWLNPKTGVSYACRCRPRSGDTPNGRCATCRSPPTAVHPTPQLLGGLASVERTASTRLSRTTTSVGHRHLLRPQGRDLGRRRGVFGR